MTADYDNVNLVNHIPFADKDQKQPPRFDTEYKNCLSKSPDKH